MTRAHHYVHLTLDNVTLAQESLEHTPSMEDGIDPTTEMDLRIYGCELIQQAGVHPRLLYFFPPCRKVCWAFLVC